MKGPLEASLRSDPWPQGIVSLASCICPLYITHKVTFYLLIEQHDIFLIKRQRPNQQRIQNNATGPDIDTGALILPLTYNLRSGIVRTATGRLQQFPILHQIRQPEIANLDQIVTINQNILRFQIPVTDQILMHVLHASDDLSKVELCLIFGNFIILNEIV